MSSLIELTPEAERVRAALLDAVPPGERDAVQALADAESGRNATRAGRDSVDVDDVVKGFILATPLHLRPALKRSMAEAGIDVSAWAAYFTL